MTNFDPGKFIDLKPASMTYDQFVYLMHQVQDDEVTTAMAAMNVDEETAYRSVLQKHIAGSTQNGGNDNGSKFTDNNNENKDEKDKNTRPAITQEEKEAIEKIMADQKFAVNTVINYPIFDKPTLAAVIAASKVKTPLVATPLESKRSSLKADFDARYLKWIAVPAGVDEKAYVAEIYKQIDSYAAGTPFPVYVNKDAKPSILGVNISYTKEEVNENKNMTTDQLREFVTFYTETGVIPHSKTTLGAKVVKTSPKDLTKKSKVLVRYTNRLAVNTAAPEYAKIIGTSVEEKRVKSEFSYKVKVIDANTQQVKMTTDGKPRLRTVRLTGSMPLLAYKENEKYKDVLAAKSVNYDTDLAAARVALFNADKINLQRSTVALKDKFKELQKKADQATSNIDI